MELVKTEAGQIETGNPYKVALTRAEQQIKAVLPAHLDARRMIQVAVMQVHRNPDLQKCHPMSVVAAVIQAAECGLEPGGPMQHGDLLRVWNSRIKDNECQFRPRYGGLVQLARNTNELKSIYAEVVYRGDQFRVRLGFEPSIEHEPDFEAARADEDIIAAYAVAKLQNGEVQFTVLTRSELEKIRAKSETEKAKASGRYDGATVWEEWYSEMAKKSAVKRLCKLLPKSVAFARAIEVDDAPMVVTEEREWVGSEQAAQDVAARKIAEAEARMAHSAPAAPAEENGPTPPPEEPVLSSPEPAQSRRQAFSRGK